MSLEIIRLFRRGRRVFPQVHCQPRFSVIFGIFVDRRRCVHLVFGRNFGDMMGGSVGWLVMGIVGRGQ